MSTTPTHRPPTGHGADATAAPLASPRSAHSPLEGPEIPPLTQDRALQADSPHAQASPSDQRIRAASHTADLSGATALSSSAARVTSRSTSQKSPLVWLSTVGLALLILGGLMTLTGLGSYVATSSALGAEKIVVPKDAAMFAGADVADPFTAWSTQATIRKHADGMAGGKTYAELPKEDPKRAQLQTASFLRSSILVSVLAFGMSALIAGLGLIVALIGFALRKVALQNS